MLSISQNSYLNLAHLSLNYLHKALVSSFIVLIPRPTCSVKYYGLSSLLTGNDTVCAKDNSFGELFQKELQHHE